MAMKAGLLCDAPFWSPQEGALTFDVLMGEPQMRALWNRLQTGATAGTLGADDVVLARKFAKAVRHLGMNPFHPGLQSHEVDDLTKRYGRRVFQSYLENNTPAAGRLFWVYGPERLQISVIGLEPHPEDDKNRGYARVLLSTLPPVTPVKPASLPRANPLGDVKPRTRRRT